MTGCLSYINSMPMIFAFRIVDCFMAMGPKVLFQIGLAILKINGEALLEVTDQHVWHQDTGFIRVSNIFECFRRIFGWSRSGMRAQ